MRDGFGRDGGISLDGARAFVVGLLAFCAGCVAIDYGTERISAAFESSANGAPEASAASGTVNVPPLAGVFGAAGTLAPLRRPQSAIAKAPAAAPSPCAKPLNPRARNAAASSSAPAGVNRAKPARAAAPAPAAAASARGSRPAPTSAASQPIAPRAALTARPAVNAARAAASAPLAAPASAPLAAPASVRPIPAARRHRRVPSVPPPAIPAATAAHPAGGLLVPFNNPAALTSKGALDPRAASQAPLLVNPGAAAAPPEAGSLRNR